MSPVAVSSRSVVDSERLRVRVALAAYRWLMAGPEPYLLRLCSPACYWLSSHHLTQAVFCHAILLASRYGSILAGSPAALQASGHVTMVDSDQVAWMASHHVTLLVSQHVAVLATRHMTLLASQHTTLLASRHVTLLASSHVTLLDSRYGALVHVATSVMYTNILQTKQFET
jgi:hypothetical protein